MTKTIEEAAREAVRKNFLCEKCAWEGNRNLCGGDNTAFDCCECPADSYVDGFKAGAVHLMSLPLTSRMTEEEKERVRELHYHLKSVLAYCHPSADRIVETTMCDLESIFGKEFFEEE